MPKNTVIALLSWNFLNPISKTEARIWLALLVVVCVWIFGPVVAQWWRNRR